jgi:hypothetical protein
MMREIVREIGIRSVMNTKVAGGRREKLRGKSLMKEKGESGKAASGAEQRVVNDINRGNVENGK